MSKELTVSSIEGLILKAARKAVVGKLCTILGYGGGLIIDTGHKSPILRNTKFDKRIDDVSFRFTTISDVDSSYGNTPSYELYLTLTDVNTGHTRLCLVDIRDVL